MDADRLSDIEAFAASAVLEDVLDKLKVMKHILPPVVNDRARGKSAHVIRSDVSHLLTPIHQSVVGLQAFAQNGPGEEDPGRGSGESGGGDVAKAEDDRLGGDAGVVDGGGGGSGGGGGGEPVDPMLDEEWLEAVAHHKLHSLPRDDLQKAQQDRNYVEDVLTETLQEICEKRSFNALRRRISEALEERRCLERIVEREAEAEERIAALTKELSGAKQTRSEEVGRRKKRLAFLKNELQELKAKTRMEDSFLKKSTVLEVDWTKKRNAYEENRLNSEIQKLQSEIENETRCNAEMESFIGVHQAELEMQVEMWMDKYERDYDAKMNELDTLKKMMAADKERLEELTILYAEYENIVVTERIERERQRRRAEKERRENEATLRIQSWWRGVIIRKGMRLMKPPKKKGKKGRKGRRK